MHAALRRPDHRLGAGQVAGIADFDINFVPDGLVLQVHKIIPEPLGDLGLVFNWTRHRNAKRAAPP